MRSKVKANMLNFTNLENESQNYNEISSHNCKNSYQKIEVNKDWQKCESRNICAVLIVM